MTVSDPNVANNATNTITGIASGTASLSNYALYSLASAGSSGTQTGSVWSGVVSGGVNSGGTNTVTLSKATLGLLVSAIYNGTTTFGAADNLIVLATGLKGSESITGVTVNSKDVSANGSNYVISFSGSANPLNYSINSSASYATAGGTTYAGSSSDVATSTSNAVWVNAVSNPLAITLSGTYNGTTSYTNGSGVSIVVSGLVGSDIGKKATTVVINDKNITSTNHIESITSAEFNVANYAINANYYITGASIGSPVVGASAATSTNAAQLSSATLTITGATTTVSYTGSTQTNSYSVAGLLGSDSVTGVSGRATGTSASTTPYVDTLSAATGSGLSNYTISYSNGSLTITAVTPATATPGAPAGGGPGTPATPATSNKPTAPNTPSTPSTPAKKNKSLDDEYVDYRLFIPPSAPYVEIVKVDKKPDQATTPPILTSVVLPQIPLVSTPAPASSVTVTSASATTSTEASAPTVRATMPPATVTMNASSGGATTSPVTAAASTPTANVQTTAATNAPGRSYSVDLKPPPGLAINSAPEYPEAAKSRGVQGQAIVQVTVDPQTRTVTQISLRSSSGSSDLDQAALAAAKTWAYNPQESKVDNAPQVFEVPVNFTISGAQ